MSDLIHLQSGARPWLPTPDSETVHILDEYNIPLAGILRQHGVHYMFVCAAGEEENSNVWLYAMVDAADEARLMESTERSVLREMAHTLQNRPITAALADQWQVVLWESFESGADQPGTLVKRFLRLLDARVRRYGSDIDRLERDPSIDADNGQLAISY